MAIDDTLENSAETRFRFANDNQSVMEEAPLSSNREWRRLESIAESTCSSAETDMTTSSISAESTEVPHKQAGVGLILQIVEGQGLIVQGLAKSLLLQEEQDLVHVGDTVESIDGMSIIGWKLRDVNPLLLGDPCSLVTLGLLRPNRGRTFVTLTRLCPAPGMQNSNKAGPPQGASHSVVASDLEKFRLSLQATTAKEAPALPRPFATLVAGEASEHLAATMQTSLVFDAIKHPERDRLVDILTKLPPTSPESSSSCVQRGFSHSGQPAPLPALSSNAARHLVYEAQSNDKEPDQRPSSSFHHRLDLTNSTRAATQEADIQVVKLVSSRADAMDPAAAQATARRDTFAMDDRQSSIRALASNPQRAQVNIPVDVCDWLPKAPTLYLTQWFCRASMRERERVCV
jgi:hypothetical protein